MNPFHLLLSGELGPGDWALFFSIVVDTLVFLATDEGLDGVCVDEGVGAGDRDMLFTRDAKLREHTVSGASDRHGDTCTNINTLESPLRQSCNRKVSEEFL